MTKDEQRRTLDDLRSWMTDNDMSHSATARMLGVPPRKLRDYLNEDYDAGFGICAEITHLIGQTPDDSDRNISDDSNDSELDRTHGVPNDHQNDVEDVKPQPTLQTEEPAPLEQPAGSNQFQSTPESTSQSSYLTATSDIVKAMIEISDPMTPEELVRVVKGVATELRAPI